jgi:hypothetical protein
MRKLSIFTIVVLLLSGWLDGFILPRAYAADEVVQVYDVDYMGIETFDNQLRKQADTTTFGSFYSSRLAFKFPIQQNKPIASVVLGFMTASEQGATFRISAASSDSWTTATPAASFPGVLAGSEKIFTFSEFTQMVYTEMDVTSLITPAAIAAGDPGMISLILYGGDIPNQWVTIGNRSFNEEMGYEVGPYLKITYDTTPPALVSSTLAADNAYVDLTFSEGVYRNPSGTVGLNASSLKITDFALNGGSASGISIVSVKRNDDPRQSYASDLSGGETTVRVFLNVVGTPSGLETFEVRPANEFSIYDRAGNASASTLTTGAQALRDKAPPLLTGAVRDSDTRITVQLNENAAAAGLSKANNGGFTVEETGNASVTYAVSGVTQGSDARHAVLTVANMGRSGKEGVTVKYTAGGNGTIADVAGNAMATNTIGRSIGAWDDAAPTLSGSSAVAAANAYVDLTFSEGVYGSAAATGGLGAASLQIANFAANGGTATGVSIASVKRADQATAASASALSGGETTVRVFLEVTGVASGVETFEVRAGSAASIFDLAGNAAAASLTTGAKTLLDAIPPVLAGAVRNNDTQITVELSKEAAAATITKSGPGGFAVEATGNSAAAYPVTGITPGSDTRHVVLTVADLSSSGKAGVTVKYTAGGNGTVADAAGNAMATDAVGVPVAGWDVTAPLLMKAVRDSGTQITVELSEDVSAASVTKSHDGGFHVSEQDDDAVTYPVTAIAPGNDASHVVLTVASTDRSGKEGLTVTYTAGGHGTVQDIAGNALESDAIGQKIASWDNTAPTLISVGTLEAGNTYIDLTFSEGVYGNAAGSAGLDVDNLRITDFAANGGTATNVEIAAVKRADHAAASGATALSGGETTVRVFLKVTGTPGGMEQFKIRPAGADAIHDLAGNAALASLTTGVLTLHDLLPPELVSVVRDSDTQLTVELSEAVAAAGATQSHDGGFTVTERDNDAIGYTVTSIAPGGDAKHIVLTVAHLGRSAKEGVTVTYTAGGSGAIDDLAGNRLLTDANGLTAAGWDTTAPVITASGAIAQANAYVDVSFSEGVYGGADAVQGLDSNALKLLFAANGGGAAGASIAAVKAADGETAAAASALNGGETTVRVFLNITGSASGTETIELVPLNETTIYDLAGNATALTATTGAIALRDTTAPLIEGAVRDSDTQITVELSKAVTAASATKANDGGFIVRESGNPAVAYTVAGIAPGSDARHVVLTVADLGRSAKEGVTVTYAAGGNGAIADAVGNALATDATGYSLEAWDTTAPAITAGDAVAAGNVYVDVAFSEGVYGQADGMSAVGQSSLQIVFAANGGAAAGVSIAAVKAADGDNAAAASALIGGETVLRIFLNVAGTPSGVETIEIMADGAASLYDRAGNAASVSETTGSKLLHDMTPPVLVAAARTSETRITLELSEAVPEAGVMQPNDGGFAVRESGNPAVSYAVTEIAPGIEANQVVLTVASLERSAKEGVTVTYTAGGNGLVADAAGNAMATDAIGALVAPWDTTAPAFVSAELFSNNAYMDVAFSEGVYGDAAGNQPLQASQLRLLLERNGGGVTALAIRALAKNDAATSEAASPLEGGETVIRVFLQATGTAYGVETVALAPLDGASVYDYAGNSAAAELRSVSLKLFDRQTYSSGPLPEDGVITVNGVKQEMIGSYRTATINGEKSTTVQVNERIMLNKLAEFDQGAVITFSVTNGSGRVTVELAAPTIKAMESRGVLLVVETENAVYRIPAEQIGVSALLADLGADESPEKASVLIEISKLAETEATGSEASMSVAGTTFDFTIRGVYGEKQVDVTAFSRYVERAIALPAGYSPDQIATGVAVDGSGKLLHVPTRFEKLGDSYFAMMSSLSNSTYKLIRHEKTFADIRNHWSRANVEDMAARLIVGGVNDAEFKPDQAITRAEFLAIAVRALGLRHMENEAVFTDVEASAWYAEAVQLGVSYGLVSGYADGAFRPGQAITREEAMVILARMLPIVGLASQIEPAKQDNVLASFHNLQQLSDWARSAAALTISNGLIYGYEGELLPKHNITRAETATVIARLLKAANLI